MKMSNRKNLNFVEYRFKEKNNSLRLFLIFLGGFFLLHTTKFFAFFGGIGMVFSIMGFLHNAEIFRGLKLEFDE